MVNWLRVKKTILKEGIYVTKNVVLRKFVKVWQINNYFKFHKVGTCSTLLIQLQQCTVKILIQDTHNIT